MDTPVRVDIDLGPGPDGDDPSGDSLLFIGNATMLLRVGGFTVLTDPTFVHRHEKVDLGWGMSSTRLSDPALDIPDLPPLDAVLLSHFHGDHFDQVAERDLDRSLPVVTTPQAVEQLAERGFDGGVGLDTWQSATLLRGERRLRITSCPGRHGPGVSDLLLPDVMGSVLEWEPTAGGPTKRLYVSGDTLVHDALAEVPRRWPELDVGVLHLGGTRVMGLLVTMDAEQGVEAVRLIGPRTVVPVHYDDYDVFTSSLEDFLAAAAEAGVDGSVRPVRRGDLLPL